jgi:hypothetical protein
VSVTGMMFMIPIPTTPREIPDTAGAGNPDSRIPYFNDRSLRDVRWNSKTQRDEGTLTPLEPVSQALRRHVVAKA